MSASRKGRVSSSDHADESIARKKERLDNAIYRLKGKVGGFSDDENNKSDVPVLKTDSKEFSEQAEKTSSNESLTEITHPDSSDAKKYDEKKFRIIPKADILNVYYCMWENTSNVCWLDASMALLAHNQTLRYEANLSGSAQIIRIIKYYNEAICSLNDGRPDRDIEEKLNRAKEYLNAVQELSLKYLQPILKYNEGDPESAFCSLYNLISEDKKIKNYFEVTFTRSFLCDKCGKNRTTTQTKPIITLPKVVAFKPSSPVTVTECPSCKAQDQRIHVSYKSLSNCLIFHFEGGAGKGELQPLDFTIGGRDYKITGLMTLEKARETTMDHFVSWIRDPSSDSWLECNDLNPDVLNFTVIPPQYINLEDVCIIMFEAFDDLGTIELKSPQADSEEKFNLEDESGDANIPFIDLSQDIEEHGCASDRTEGLFEKETSHSKKTSMQGDSDKLDFSKNRCSKTNLSEVGQQSTHNDVQKNPLTYHRVQQMDMLKQLDLKPKFDGMAKRVSDENVPSVCFEKIQSDAERNVSLQDTLSPRCTDIIMKLAKQNDEIERNKSHDLEEPKEPIRNSEVLKQDDAEVSDQSLGKPLLLSTTNIESCQGKRTCFANTLSDKEYAPAEINLQNIPCNKNGEKSLVQSNSLVKDDDNSINETKLYLEQQHARLSEILASKSNSPIHSNFKAQRETRRKGKRKIVEVQDNPASSSDEKKGENIETVKSLNEKENQVISDMKKDSSQEVKRVSKPLINKKSIQRPVVPIEVEVKIMNTNEVKENFPYNLESEVSEESDKFQKDRLVNECTSIQSSSASSLDKLIQRIGKSIKKDTTPTVKEPIYVKQKKGVTKEMAHGNSQKIKSKSPCRKKGKSVTEPSNTSQNARAKKDRENDISPIKESSNVQTKQIVIKLFKLTPEDILKYTSENVLPVIKSFQSVATEAVTDKSKFCEKKESPILTSNRQILIPNESSVVRKKRRQYKKNSVAIKRDLESKSGEFKVPYVDRKKIKLEQLPTSVESNCDKNKIPLQKAATSLVRRSRRKRSNPLWRDAYVMESLAINPEISVTLKENKQVVESDKDVLETKKKGNSILYENLSNKTQRSYIKRSEDYRTSDSEVESGSLPKKAADNEFNIADTCQGRPPPRRTKVVLKCKRDELVNDRDLNISSCSTSEPLELSKVPGNPAGRRQRGRKRVNADSIFSQKYSCASEDRLQSQSRSCKVKKSTRSKRLSKELSPHITGLQETVGREAETKTLITRNHELKMERGKLVNSDSFESSDSQLFSSKFSSSKFQSDFSKKVSSPVKRVNTASPNRLLSPHVGTIKKEKSLTPKNKEKIPPSKRLFSKSPLLTPSKTFTPDEPKANQRPKQTDTSVRESECTAENIDYTVDCLVDYYLAKTYYFFGFGLNEY